MDYLIKNKNESAIFYSGHFANFELMAMELDKSGIKIISANNLSDAAKKNCECDKIIYVNFS